MSYLEVFGVLTGVGVDVSKFFGVGAGVLMRGAGAVSESEKGDSAHLCRTNDAWKMHAALRTVFENHRSTNTTHASYDVLHQRKIKSVQIQLLRSVFVTRKNRV